MARDIDSTELLELLTESVNNENPLLHLMSFYSVGSWMLRLKSKWVQTKANASLRV